MDAARRWRQLVRGRLGETDRLRPEGSPQGRARSMTRQFAASCSLERAAGDPFASRVRRVAGRRTSVLDVGAGPGRFTLALAPHVERIVAVDPSSKLLAGVRREAKQRGLTNVTTVVGRWEEVEVEPADVVICAFVLPLIADVVPFVRKLDASARRRVMLYLGAYTPDTVVDPLWRHFHGKPRRPGATWIDALDVLRDLGIEPDVEVVEITVRTRYESVAEAAADYRRALLVPPTRQARRELEDLLSVWLVRRDGALRPPLRTAAAAILNWTPTQTSSD